MRLIEILNEKHVESTWITDLIHNRPNKTITMRLSNGRSYSIPGITRTGFERWVNYGSKGAYFHNFIKGKHTVTRLR